MTVRIIMAVLLIILGLSSFVSAYQGRMDIAIYTAIWAMWIDLLAAINRIR